MLAEKGQLKKSSNDASYFLTFAPNTQPLIAYAVRRIGAAGLSVEAHDNILLINAPSSLLEAEAEKVKLERPLRTDKPLALSERDWPRREFSVAERDDFASPASFSPAERALLVGLLLDAVPTDDALPAALAAAGVAAAPTHSRSLLHVLEAAGAVVAAAPLHDDGARDAAWRSSVRQLARGRSLDADVFAAYWGEGVAFYFAWSGFYLKALAVPALLGFAIWLRRPADLLVDDDPYVPAYALLTVVWACGFVALWRRKEAALDFKWGCADAQEYIRSDFEGDEVTSEVTGETVRRERPARRAARYALSIGVTLVCLAVPVAVMLVSLNLQGYISPLGRDVLGVPVYSAAVSAYAKPGATFDPNGSLALVPVVIHAVTIALLNKGYRHIAEYLTDFENHRTQRAYENSLVLKRFFFEAFDCYVALFYIAFELGDVSRLRMELVSLYTSDTVRRIATETVLPLLLQRGAALRGGGDAASALRRARRDADLDEYEQFDDYLEWVIQFGYVVLFASAFPLAGALSLVCNAVELLADVFKVTYLCRRPRPSRARGIGIWLWLLYALAVTAIFTNLAIFAVASDQMAVLLPSLFSPRPTWRGGRRLPFGLGGRRAAEDDFAVRADAKGDLAFILVSIEHAILLAFAAAELLVPLLPKWARVAKARRAHEAEGARRRAIHS